MIEILITLLFGALIVYAIQWFIGQLALPAQAKQIILIIVAILALVWLAELFGVYTFPR